MPPPKLVIFDCDGVLVDSEPISVAVLLDVLAKAGCHIDAATSYATMLGRSLTSVMAMVRDEYGLELTDDHLIDLRTQLYARFRSDLKPIAGVAEAVNAIGCARCVASSSQMERIRLSLSVTGLLDLLSPHIFSATMVENGKPAPDLFLFAAQQMGVSPADCVVIEDSTAGIQAAQAAGMRVVAFTGGSHAGPANLDQRARALAPWAIIDRMDQLPALLHGSN